MRPVFNFISNNKRLVLFIHKQNKRIIWMSVLKALLSSTLPYIYIVGSAIIIDALLNQSYDLALQYAIIMIVSHYLLQMIYSVVQTEGEIGSMAINRICNTSILLKSIDLDYATFEDKKTLEEFSAADNNTSRQGGFGSYLISFNQFMEGLFSACMASIFVFDLCLKVASNHEYASLVSVSTSISLVVILIVLLAFSYSKIISYVNTNNLEVFKNNVSVDQKFMYFIYYLFPNDQIAKDIRLFHMKSFLFKKWKHLGNENFINFKKETKFLKNSLLGYQLMNDLVLLLSYLFVCLKAITTAISIGQFTQYIGVFRQFNMSLKLCMEAIGQMQLKTSYLSYYLDYIKKGNQFETGTKQISPRFNHTITFHNVSFSYPNSDTYVLRNVSCTLEGDNKYAIVGRNGAGKTTFIKLLCRLYDVSEGEIKLDGINIKEYDYTSYLNHFAIVFQDFALFAMSLKENIASQEEVNLERLQQCLAQVDMDDFIKQQEKGLDTLLYQDMGDGIGVSGGQAQKLAIARALYKDSPIVILDEPTAALDPISEYEIYKQFNTMVKEKMSLYISHRMSSCQFCDQILVFDDGHLSQEGSHEQLMAQEGVYASLWNAQAKYYNESPV